MSNLNLTRVEVTRGENETWRMKGGETGVIQQDATWSFVFVLNHPFVKIAPLIGQLFLPFPVVSK